MLNLLQLQRILSAEFYCGHEIMQNQISAFAQSRIFNSVGTDSRKLEDKCLFIALKGDNFDAHDFIHTLDKNKVVGVVVEKHIKNTDIPQLIVADAKKALQKLANHWRNQFDIPIVGVVGSNGKTTVKEMIYSTFQYNEWLYLNRDQAIATQGNLNNDIGLPLSILRLKPYHKLAVFELGMNHPQETILLSKILQPTIAIINNAQREHQEFMQTVEMVAIEHGYLLEETNRLQYAVLPYDSPFYAQWKKQCDKNNIKVKSFGFNKDADIHSLNADVSCKFNINLDNQEFNLQTIGLHNASNALAAIAVAKCADVPINVIVHGLENFTGVKGRLQKSSIKFIDIENKDVKEILLINDTYNANPDSVKAAIDVLSTMTTPEHKTLLVLGDMGEVGENGAEFHTEIGEYAKQNKINAVYTLGSLAQNIGKAFYAENSTDVEKYSFEKIQDLFDLLAKEYQNFNTILIKGSRFMKMERVVEYLHSIQ
ncbi:MAG: UDP-N-acetylmuramoyl-tripeptide--D-alanyl-D-alanine ligase [Pseudomonadota bacterium]|jgi:UDP-N-acetylmuramoyl-tripeptide--D-alanyl-D-alanine ligase